MSLSSAKETLTARRAPSYAQLRLRRGGEGEEVVCGSGSARAGEGQCSAVSLEKPFGEKTTLRLSRYLIAHTHTLLHCRLKSRLA